eukprot:g14995.t1
MKYRLMLHRPTIKNPALHVTLCAILASQPYQVIGFCDEKEKSPQTRCFSCCPLHNRNRTERQEKKKKQSTLTKDQGRFRVSWHFFDSAFYVSETPSITPSVSESPSITPSVSESPSITPSVSESPSITPSVSESPSITPTISVTPSTSASTTPTVSETASVTPSVTPTISVTPSVTPTISVTPSVTPTISASSSVTHSSSMSPAASPSKSIVNCSAYTKCADCASTGAWSETANGKTRYACVWCHHPKTDAGTCTNSSGVDFPSGTINASSPIETIKAAQTAYQAACPDLSNKTLAWPADPLNWCRIDVLADNGAMAKAVSTPLLPFITVVAVWFALDSFQ